ncbi:MAG: uroporphyrinogen decarboxylase family protein [Kiritimatiellia bacterium]
MMSSKECVQRAVKFKKPDRIPLGIMPPGFVSDLYCIGPTADPAWKPKVNTEREREDEFGCIWSKLKDDKTMGQVTCHPLADFSRLDSFKFPDYTIRARYDSAREILKKNTGNKFVLAGIPLSLIHRLEYLRGHEAAWTDPYESPDRLRKLLNRLADMAIEAVDRFAELGVDGVMSSDDWGLQDRPMVSPDMFAEFWKPAYKRVYSHAHGKGMLTMLHSCGNIADLLEHFIEAELDVIQMDQQENMGMENLARRFGGRICFWCPVDIQQTMVRGSVEDVRAYARRLIDTFGKFDGGFMAQWYASPQAIGHTDEKIKAMCGEFRDYGGKFYLK